MLMQLQIFLVLVILIWRDVEHSLLVLAPHSIITAFGYKKGLYVGDRSSERLVKK